MMSAFSSLVSESSELILCFYTNCTNKIQILRVNSNQNLSFERIVFPGQRLLFKALPDAQLEIHTNQKENSTEDFTSVKTFSCVHLRVHEEMSA
jgi:3-hydroxymyristoyl/3-hydroxydecanoyl-(acyl carrier protein) dehydratase